MKLPGVIFSLFYVSILGGCIVLHSGSVGGGTPFSSRDKYVDIAKGETKTVFVFGFGDLGRQDLVENAKLNMYFNRPLQKDEYYTYPTTSITNKIILGFIHITRVCVSAEVLRMNDTLTDVFSSSFKKQIHTEKTTPAVKVLSGKVSVEEKTRSSIHLAGDSVYYSKNAKHYNLYVVTTVNNENTLLLSTNANEKNVLVPSSNAFFIKNIELDGFKSGSLVSAEILDPYNSTTFEEGKVMGVSEGYFLVLTKSGFHVLPAIKLKAHSK